MPLTRPPSPLGASAASQSDVSECREASSEPTGWTGNVVFPTHFQSFLSCLPTAVFLELPRPGSLQALPVAWGALGPGSVQQLESRPLWITFR